jgi:hypothetical protein
MADESCSKGFISVIIVYAVSLMYLFQKHTKFWGYAMLIIAYIFSYGYVFQFRDPLLKGVNEFIKFVHGNTQNAVDNMMITTFFSQSVLYKIFLFFGISFVFMNVYSLIKILNAYSFKSTKTGSFDLKLNKKHTKELKIFDWSFIIGNVSFFAFVYYLVSAGVNSMVKFEYKWLLLLFAFISVWFVIGTAIEFSYIKRE